MGTTRQTLRLYWEVVSKHKPSFFVAFTAIPLGIMVTDTFLPYTLSQAIARLTHSDLAGLHQMLWISAGVGLLGSLLNFIGYRTIVWHEACVRPKLFQTTFEKLIDKDHSFFANRKIGTITSRYADFIRSEATLQSLLVSRTLGNLLSVLSGVTVLLFYSPWVALLVAVYITAMFFQVRWRVRYTNNLKQERNRVTSAIYGRVTDAMTNNLVVRTFTGERYESQQLQKLTNRFGKIWNHETGISVIEANIRMGAMALVQIIAIAIIGGITVSGGLSVAGAIFVLAYLQRISSHLYMISEIVKGYEQSFLDAQPMTEMLMSSNDVTDKPSAKQLTVTDGAIQFSDVAYRYQDSASDVLTDITFTVQPGQKVGLVGYSGSGKTTITQLLLRFYDVSRGAIAIDGQNIQEVSQTSLRSQISYVPQEPLLFHRSVRDNIAYANPEATTEEIIDATKKANAWDFIQELPEGLDTVVGERGVKLSGGQRQRIAIARAILKNAPILVLDEATSALDSKSEALIQQSLDDLMQRRTSIVVAHRLSTIAGLDRIIVLDHGKIVEDGTHQELLDKNGRYAALWRRQAGQKQQHKDK